MKKSTMSILAQCGYEIFSEIINNLFGPDIVAQKNINLIIQNPQDDTQIPYIETHQFFV